MPYVHSAPTSSADLTSGNLKSELNYNFVLQNIQASRTCKSVVTLHPYLADILN